MMENSKYFIVETKKVCQHPKPTPDNQLVFSEVFEIEGHFLMALEFKLFKSIQEVKNIIIEQDKTGNFDEKLLIMPIIKEIKKYSKCDILYVTNIPKTLNNPKQLIEKFCIGVGKITKCFCYYTVISGKENLERLRHFLPTIPIETFRIMASYSCIDFPLLRFSNLSLITTAEKLKSFILKYSNCNVVDIKMSKPAQNKNDKYANVLFQSVEEIENVTKSFNFSILDGNEIYVKQFLEPDLGVEIKKYEIAVVDLPKDTEKINFFKEMSNFGRIFEFFFDEQSLIGYVVFVTPESRKKLLESPKFHTFYSLVTILVGNFPPDTTCEDAKNYVVETIQMQSKSSDKKSSSALINTKDSNEIVSSDSNDDNDNDNKNLNDNQNANEIIDYDQLSNFVFDPNSIKEVKVYQEVDQFPSSDPTQGKLYFTLPTFSFTFSHPSLIDFVLDKIQSGTYKNKTVPYAIRYYPHTKYNDNVRSGILKNLGYDNAIEISPIDSKVTLSKLFDICSSFGVILYFQINLKKIPNYCIVKYKTTESFTKALEDIDGSTLNNQKISAMQFKLERKGADQSDNSESQDKTDESSTKSSKNKKNKKNKKNTPKDDDSDDFYYDTNNQLQYPPFYPRFPYPMQCDPRFMCRPFPFRPPPPPPPPMQSQFNQMCPGYPYPFYPPQRPPPPPFTPEQRELWNNYYHGYNCCRGHCHHKKHCQKNEKEGNSDDENKNNKKSDIDPSEFQKKGGRGCRGWRKNRFYNEGGSESEDNEKRGPRHGRNRDCNKNWEQKGEQIDGDDTNNNKDESSSPEMQQFRGPKHCRNCNRHRNWEQKEMPVDGDTNNNQDESPSPEMQQFRGPKHCRNCNRYRNWEQKEMPADANTNDNQEDETSPEMQQFRGPKHCRNCNRYRNWEQKEMLVDANSNDNQEDQSSPEMRQWRGPKRWQNYNRCRNRDQTDEPVDSNANNNDADDSREIPRRRGGPRCFGFYRNGWNGYQPPDESNQPEDSEQNDERRGPHFHGGCRHCRGQFQRFGHRGGWWENRGGGRFGRDFRCNNFDQNDEEGDDQNGGRGCNKGCRRGERCRRDESDKKVFSQQNKEEEKNENNDNDDNEIINDEKITTKKEKEEENNENNDEIKNDKKITIKKEKEEENNENNDEIKNDEKITIKKEKEEENNENNDNDEIKNDKKITIKKENEKEKDVPSNKLNENSKKVEIDDFEEDEEDEDDEEFNVDNIDDDDEEDDDMDINNIDDDEDEY